jgi:hypothetical protein
MEFRMLVGIVPSSGEAACRDRNISEESAKRSSANTSTSKREQSVQVAMENERKRSLPGR